jgi:hypothetical protein
MGPAAHSVVDSVSRVRLHLNAGLAVDAVIRSASWWGYGLAVVVIVLKAGGWHHRFSPAYLLATVAGVGVVAFADVWRNRYGRDDAAAWLDARARCGGAVMACEAGMGARVRLPQNLSTHLPRFTAGPAGRALGLPLLLLIGAYLVPGAAAGISFSPKVVRDRATEIREHLEEARAMEVLDQQRLDSLDEDASEIARQAEERPETAMEGLDSIQASLDRQVLDAARTRLERMAEAAKWEEKATDGRGMTPEEVRSALRSAAAAATGSQAGNEALKKALKEAMGQLGAGSRQELANMSASQLKGLDPATAGAIARALRNGRASQLRRMGRCSGKVCSPGAQTRLSEALSKLPRLSQSGRPGAMGGRLGTATGSRFGVGRKPGRGGISRGRGDAPMAYGNETDRAGMRFRDGEITSRAEVMPGSTIAVRSVAADELPPEEFRPPARTGAAVDGPVRVEAGTGSLAPRREEAASRYFESVSGQARGTAD